MSLSGKKVILITDDANIETSVGNALMGKHANLRIAKSDAEAIALSTEDAPDAYVIRLKTPNLSLPQGAFNWAVTKPKTKKTPWVVLGKDIEDESFTIKYDHIKFVADYSKPENITTVLEGLLFGSESAQDSQKIDVNFLNPLVSAVANVLKQMAQLELKKEAPYLKKPDDKSKSKADISGIIAMNSNRFLGSLAISYQEPVALKLFSNMMGSPVDAINDDVKDAIAELTNIIFGNAKRDLNANGHTITPALPSVITGKDHEIRHSVHGFVLCIPFSVPEGQITVECVIKNRS